MVVIDFLFNIPTGYLVYDIETYPNVFTVAIEHADSDQRWYFEVSDWQNDLELFIKFCRMSADIGNTWVGFNNLAFDYPVIHRVISRQCTVINRVISRQCTTSEQIAKFADTIIKSGRGNDRFKYQIAPWDQKIKQLDLYKIHHFDNIARATSLKELEFNMKLESVEDLPFKPGTVLTESEVEKLRAYNFYDVHATKLFLKKSLSKIQFRDELSAKYDRDFTNHNDTKVGKDYFIMELERHQPGCCYIKVDGKRKPRQTIRQSIKIADVILPIVNFEHPEFKRVLDWLRAQEIKETKGVFDNLEATIDGFTFVFGTGGMHGSVDSTVYETSDDYKIIDVDVASYYPNLSIKNNLHPAHLGELFCKVYEDLYNQRKQHKKGTAENAMLKLALNGVYGDSNSKWSPFYDPQYTMAITINGQLLLCMLAEWLMKTPGLKVIQINTDGITCKVPTGYIDHFNAVCEYWQQYTKLTLEDVEYKKMFILNVNAYLAIGMDNSVKLKKDYFYDDINSEAHDWAKSHSGKVIAKAAEAYLVHGTPVREFLLNHTDKYDFLLRQKAKYGCHMEYRGVKQAKLTRYYVSTTGAPLEKVMPPKGPEGAFKRKNSLPDEYYEKISAEVGDAWDERIHTKNKSVYEIRREFIHKGYNVTIANDMSGLEQLPGLNLEWYIKEVERIVTFNNHG